MKKISVFHETFYRMMFGTNKNLHMKTQGKDILYHL